MKIILRSKKTGKYVGPKATRSWSTKEVDDMQHARVFESVGGANSWFGKRYDKITKKQLSIYDRYIILHIEIIVYGEINKPISFSRNL